eukprot:jgi/Chrpa1/28018/Chrysochromulina_OHIO_Genome00013649-RA
MKPRPLQDEAPDTLAAMAASRWDARHRTYTASSKRLAHATNGWNHGDWQLSTSVTDVRFQHSLNNTRGRGGSPAPPLTWLTWLTWGRPARLTPPLTWLTWLTWGRPARLPPPLTWLTWLTWGRPARLNPPLTWLTWLTWAGRLA